MNDRRGQYQSQSIPLLHLTAYIFKMIRIIIETQDFKNSKVAKILKTVIFGPKVAIDWEISPNFWSKMPSQRSTGTFYGDCTVDMYF